jgi:hypothetical protein
VGSFRVFQRLPGMLVCSQVIFIAVMQSGNPVGVRSKIVHLGGCLMRILWHLFSSSQFRFWVVNLLGPVYTNPVSHQHSVRL